MEYAGKNIVVLDLETLHAADDCRHCGKPVHSKTPCTMFAHQKIGWNNHKALGLSVGCYYSYLTDKYTFFEEKQLATTIEYLLIEEPLLVSFNGIHFDFHLMLEVLGTPIGAFTTMAQRSYDILAEIWTLDPDRKFEPGLNNLNTLCKMNNLPLKEMDGALAPRLWAEGKYDEVRTYCLGDVMRTRVLFEMACNGIPIIRGDGSFLVLPSPAL